MLFKGKCNPHHWFPNLSVPLCLEMGETYISPTEIVGKMQNISDLQTGFSYYLFAASQNSTSKSQFGITEVVQ